ncbi:MAG: M20/M25/M40 family metallo-hydrolase, partial [Planctomycetota bacterium]
MNRSHRPLLVAVGWLLAAPVLASTPDEWLDAELPAIVDFYKDLHASPELSLAEHETAAKLADAWEAAGFEVTRGVGGTGVVAVMENGDGPTLLLRTDMDALPVVEATGLSYASEVKTKDRRGATVGVMHACGHDVHMANTIGATRCLAAHRDLWRGTLVVIGQPAEELSAGAQAMLADGLLARFPRPDMAVALHAANDVA